MDIAFETKCLKSFNLSIVVTLRTVYTTFTTDPSFVERSSQLRRTKNHLPVKLPF